MHTRTHTHILLAALLIVVGATSLEGCGGGGADCIPSLGSNTTGQSTGHSVVPPTTVPDQPANPLPTPSFTVAVSPDSAAVGPGETAQYTVTATGQNGFAAPLTLSVTGLPDQTTAQFGQPQLTPAGNGATTTLSISTTLGGGKTTPAGTFELTIVATDGVTTHQSTTALTVTAPGSLNGTIQ